MAVEEPTGSSDSVGDAEPDVGPLGRRYLDLLAVERRLDAEMADALSELDASGEWGLDGSATCQAWLRQHGRMTASAASGRVKTARRLRLLPRTAEAFAAGEISSDHVRVIANGTDLAESLGPYDEIDPDRAAQLVADGEEIFVEAARKLDPGRLRKVVTHWRHAVEPQVVVADETTAVCRRKLHMSQTLEGRFVLDGELDPEGGALVKTALDSLMNPDPVDGPRRTASRQRADALVELARQNLDSGQLPTSGGEKPHLSVLVPLETLEARSGHARSGIRQRRTAQRRSRPSPCLRRRYQSHHHRRNKPGPRRRTTNPHHSAGHPPCTDRTRPWLCLARMRPTARLVRRPPHRALGQRRHDIARQHRARLPSTPHQAPRTPLAGETHRRREARGGPAMSTWRRRDVASTRRRGATGSAGRLPTHLSRRVIAQAHEKAHEKEHEKEHAGDDGNERGRRARSAQ